jgi:multiple antibiotic resistance protein
VELFAEALVTLLVVTDPVGNVPVFLALTRRRPETRRRAAWQASVVAGVVIAVFALFGQAILRALGISVASLEVAGGFILVLAALELLQPRGSSNLPEDDGVNVALVPLGTPLLAGPGAIAATMVYVQRAHGAGQVAEVLLAVLVVILSVYLALRFAHGVGQLLGENGIELLSRIVGLLLAAIAVQMTATGAFYWAQHGV